MCGLQAGGSGVRFCMRGRGEASDFVRVVCGCVPSVWGLSAAWAGLGGRLLVVCGVVTYITLQARACKELKAKLLHDAG